MKSHEGTVCRPNLPQPLLHSYYGLYSKVWSVLFLFILERFTQSPSLKGRVYWSLLARMRFVACWCICVRWVRSNGHDFLSFHTVVHLFFLTFPLISYSCTLIFSLRSSHFIQLYTYFYSHFLSFHTVVHLFFLTFPLISLKRSSSIL